MGKAYTAEFREEALKLMGETEFCYMLLIDDIPAIRPPSIPIDIIFSDTISENVLRKYIEKVLRKGDYLTLDGARWLVEAYNFRHEKENRMIWTLELISECRGIAKAKEKLSGDDLKEFKKSLSDLDEILVNPVTIPRDWGIEHIPNLLRAYYDNIFEEQFIFYNESVANRHLNEYLSGGN